MNPVNRVESKVLYNRKLFKNTRHFVHMHAWYQPRDYAGSASDQCEYDDG
jgi:hypothetical protein